jgi:cobaltochelatase CobS
MTRLVSARRVFGIDADLEVPALDEPDEHVPVIDPAYRFDEPVTLALLAGFARNRRVLLQGLHGTGKSTHIDQVAARLNWPCVRVNLDGQLSRMDLIGRDAVALRDGKQVTQFQEGILRPPSRRQERGHVVAVGAPRHRRSAEARPVPRGCGRGGGAVGTGATGRT